MKFCWRYEYAMEIHSKIYSEPLFFEYLFAFSDSLRIAQFYLKARKILMQFFFPDYLQKYHDAELLELELEQWVIVANRMFADSSSPTKVIENLNSVIISKILSTEKKVPKSINASLFLELCTIEHMKLNGIIDEKKKSRRNSATSILPISRTPIKKVQDRIESDGLNPNNKMTSRIKSDFKLGSPTAGKIVRVEIHNGGSETLNKTHLGIFVSPETQTKKKDRSQSQNKSLELFDDTYNNLRSVSPQASNNDTSREIHSFKKELKFLKGEIYQQNREKKRIQHDLETVMGSYLELSENHDELVDFTRELQVNFLHLINHLRQKSSSILNDPRLRDTINKVMTFTDYRKNHAEKINQIGVLNKKQSFSEIFNKAIHKKFKDDS